MFTVFSKRKGRSKKGGGERKKRGEGGSPRTSKGTTTTLGNSTSKEGGGRRSRKNRGGGQAVQRCSSGKSESSGRSGTRQQRKNRRRRRRKKQNQEEVQAPTEVSEPKGRNKKGRRKRKPKKRKTKAVRENVICSESSESVSLLPLSSNSGGSQPGYSHSSNFADCGPASPMQCDNLPWANLDVPMDLSLVHLQILGHGVDFDLQARKNHQRWLANLKKARK